MLERLAHGPYVQTVAGRTASGGEWHIERRTPGLLDALTDVVLKRTRMGGGGGHRKKGDELPAPFEPDTERGKQTAQGRADQLLVAARNSLSTIVRDLCETRGGQPRGLGDAEPADMAIWLAKHVHTIACDEAAGAVVGRDRHARARHRAGNRPTGAGSLLRAMSDLYRAQPRQLRKSALLTPKPLGRRASHARYGSSLPRVQHHAQHRRADRTVGESCRRHAVH
ncbi:hypothetical protein HZU38_05425 [Mycolicibacterium vanbaalenii]|uniref:hypothetical protein n=1 Tax=Mycolicibacterium vanbaalenii TaxID=110539 RepID=UPI001F3E0285|nr:hypothetical protein [Mycolicibacterium vanbaalenii]UJL29942.1 hypothetical protein HZU38_05425 [Mycolicibacterium vanbaalenii]